MLAREHSVAVHYHIEYSMEFLFLFNVSQLKNTFITSLQRLQENMPKSEDSPKVFIEEVTKLLQETMDGKFHRY